MSDEPREEEDDVDDELDEGEPGREGAKIVEDGEEIGPVTWIDADPDFAAENDGDEDEFLDDWEAGDGADE